MPRPRRPLADPSLDQMPNFAGQGYNRTRFRLRNAENINNEQAIQVLQERWEIEHQQRVQAWNALHTLDANPQAVAEDGHMSPEPDSHPQSERTRTESPTQPQTISRQSPEIGYPQPLPSLLDLINEQNNPGDTTNNNKHVNNKKRKQKDSSSADDSSSDMSETSSTNSSMTSSSEVSTVSISKKKKKKTKSIKLGGKLLNLDKADNFVSPHVMLNLRKHKYVKLYTFTDVGLSRVKTLCLAPDMDNTIEVVVSKGRNQLVAASQDPSAKAWPEDCDLSIDQIRQAAPRFLRAIKAAKWGRAVVRMYEKFFQKFFSHAETLLPPINNKYTMSYVLQDLRHQWHRALQETHRAPKLILNASHIDGFRQSLLQTRFLEQERKFRFNQQITDVTNNLRAKVNTLCLTLLLPLLLLLLLPLFLLLPLLLYLILLLLLLLLLLLHFFLLFFIFVYLLAFTFTFAFAFTTVLLWIICFSMVLLVYHILLVHCCLAIICFCCSHHYVYYYSNSLNHIYYLTFNHV